LNKTPANKRRMRKLIAVLVVGLLLSSAALRAQSRQQTVTQDSIGSGKTSATLSSDSGLYLKGYDDLEKEILNRFIVIYDLHRNAITSQIEGDVISAEEYIKAAVNSTQRLLDDVPNIQSNRRFVALYRAVLTEYQEFYGITEPLGEVEGDIFSVRDEMFGSDDDFFGSEYVHIHRNLDIGKTDVPLIQNESVSNYMAYYWIRRPETMETWLKRSEWYFPMMQRIFQEEKVPAELIYLSMIESGLQPNAVSRAKAVGLWQFMQATGVMYGLKVDSWVDERRDPEKSTRAAARHLKDLYAIWNDWHLALAAYNAGAGRIRSVAKRGSRDADFWAIRSQLPSETQKYVPSYIAATIIAGNREQFGFKNRYRPNESGLEWDTFPINGSVTLKDLAKAIQIPVDSLKFYNPELIRNATPPGKTPYMLKIPKGTRTLLEYAYTKIPPSSRRSELVHTVTKGETLGAIARNYDTSVREIMELNPGISSNVKIGQNIKIPTTIIETASNLTSGSSNISENTPSSSNPQATLTTRKTYTVRKGDTLGKIAQRNQTSVANLQRWNRLSSTKLSVGQRLYVSAPVTRTDQTNTAVTSSSSNGTASDNSEKSNDKAMRYVVKKNDNLHTIAQIHNVTVDSIKRANNLNSNRIMPGQVLVIER
jgi:membrane-bound lytic murein transglycosylase D